MNASLIDTNKERPDTPLKHKLPKGVQHPLSNAQYSIADTCRNVTASSWGPEPCLYWLKGTQADWLVFTQIYSFPISSMYYTELSIYISA